MNFSPTIKTQTTQSKSNFNRFLEEINSYQSWGLGLGLGLLGLGVRVLGLGLGVRC